jgi:hypothetical protein
MTLTSGTKLGPYEILSPIGAGKMGEAMKSLAPKAHFSKLRPGSLRGGPEPRGTIEFPALACSPTV